VISINSQYADGNNFYLLLKEDQNINQTTWLIQTLQRPRSIEEKVYIIAHIPLGSVQSQSFYASEMTEIFTNYSDVIINHFYGHTHDDQFEVLVSDTNEALTMLYVAPSVTTFYARNPSFRVYQYNTTSFEVVDYYQFFFNMTKANSEDTEPTWELSYSAKSQYQLYDLSANSWLQLAEDLTSNNTLWQTWWDNFNTKVPTGQCQGSCRTGYICSMQNANPLGGC